ncbi:DUF4232 domain-containing protein [Microbispora sp. RL4-1S]|uniref:DUF4232 domain-containing protein n=1 Tax=Microbispora oryzae TaxID=2806554 RepID=A0A940WQL3_9ACTN|nr:DUF4232 domain-containing protein [Microbispora oryzae]MBP2705306.1 DUF4232 domain-containing protein [Microbispora oryzae]
MERNRLAIRLAAAAGLLLGAAACATPAPSASLNGVTAKAAAESAAQTTSSAVRRCRTTALKAKIDGQDAGAGQRYAALVLTNTSSSACWVYGYPGLIMIDSHGDALRTRVRRESARPHRVTLRPRASAHARLHWTVVPNGAETRCPSAARLMVIPPDETAHLEIPFRAAPCDDGRIDVTPLAPGSHI